ncbi:hypothetical protein G0Q06_05745 [Puniceicoccales bacterium CK1056]|uniref:VOC domain-containing protein n=2 Tax=Oceanipulchritudo coccoides TaxID=2706888 RepID=A0A6B2M1I9_9BACT|nr:hypothetical protein [Oceanipulchritudo coccoides]
MKGIGLRELAFVGYPVTDFDAARAFYGGILGLEDLDKAVRHLEENGVKVVMGIQDYPVCRLALIADPDGNTIALHQKKPNHPDVASGPA